MSDAVALSLYERVSGCWLGKSIGGTIGLPLEGEVGPLNLTYYDPVPTHAPPNDDLELQLVWLHLLEQKCFALTQKDFAQAWIDHIHYMWDEYGRCRWNLRRGVPVPALGSFENWFGAGMGSPIRSEIWAILCAGKPEHAAAYARLDASIDHSAEGIAGEVYLAALQSLVLGGGSLEASLHEALEYIEPGTETAQALGLVFKMYDNRAPAWEAYETLVAAHGHENFTHAPLNLALIGWALINGEGDFDKSLLLGTNCGYDTDCTAATVGATMGMLVGTEAIDERWKTPIGNGVYIGPGIIGIRSVDTLEDLTDRTLALQEQFAKTEWPLVETPEKVPAVDLSDLPGTNWLRPLGSDNTVAWANGELPTEVRAAGGAEWDWMPGPEVRDECRIVALARGGCRLFVDGELVVNYPAGQPYVPAVHRPGEAAKRLFKPLKDKYRVRLELNKKDAQQDATVFLAMLNYHITSWNGDVLPLAARLDPPPARPIP